MSPPTNERFGNTVETIVQQTNTNLIPKETPEKEQIPQNEEQSNNATNNKEGSNSKKEKEEAEISWRVTGFSKIKSSQQKFSDSVSLGGTTWRLLMQKEHDTFLGLYLQRSTSVSQTWSRRISFVLSLVNFKDPKESHDKEVVYTFLGCDPSNDWGFKEFISLKEITSNSNFYQDDSILLRTVIKVVDNSKPISYGYDSKKETGYVGLKNQGATCYMNSLLQALFHTGAFRRAIYQIPTENDDSTTSIPLALQRVFYRLQFGNTAVGTKELTKSFGWDAYDSFTQHDVQEMNRVLCDKLEEKMKGTIVEGAIEKLFRGKLKNYIACINVEYQSTRMEPFYDLSLNVKGCKDIITSFEQYIEVEMLEGDNKYHADGHGLQDAKKGVLIQSFPPVLQLQLKRFEYDPYRNRTVKINDKYIFTRTLDLNKFGKDSDDANVDLTYELYGVFVHSGDVGGGHYYAFIRPTPANEWYKFDDSTVQTVPEKRAIEDNFGGEEDVYTIVQGKRQLATHKKSSNAYMLLYARKDKLAEIMDKVIEDDIPEHLKRWFHQEKVDEEMKRRERAEAHLYMSVKVVTENEIVHTSGQDLVNFNFVKTFRVKKTTTLKEFKKQAEEHFNIPPHRQRYWHWQERRNKTIRPHLQILPREEDKQFLELFRGHERESNLKFFLEISKVPEIPQLEGALFPLFPQLMEEDILLFFKYYDRGTETLKFVGSRVVQNYIKPPELYPLLNSFINSPYDTPFLLYEEVTPTRIDEIMPHTSLNDQRLENGDIIIFSREVYISDKSRLPTPVDFYHYDLNKLEITFKDLLTYNKPSEDKDKLKEVSLELSKNMSVEQVASALADKLNWKPTHIRITLQNQHNDAPRGVPLKRNEDRKLSDLLGLTRVLYYELLDISVAEMESKKVLSIHWHSLNLQYMTTYKVLVPKDGKIGDILTQLYQQVELTNSNTNQNSETTQGTDHPVGSGKIRLMEVWQSKIFKIFYNQNDPISTIVEHRSSEVVRLRAEEVPHEQTNLSDGEHLVSVTHFFKESYTNTIRTYGVPFLIKVSKGEILSETKQKIQKILKVSPEEFSSKWKIALINLTGRADYLQNDNKTWYGRSNYPELLGLEHPTQGATLEQQNLFRNPYNFSMNGGGVGYGAAFGRRKEKPIKIYN